MHRTDVRECSCGGLGSPLSLGGVGLALRGEQDNQEAAWYKWSEYKRVIGLSHSFVSLPEVPWVNYSFKVGKITLPGRVIGSTLSDVWVQLDLVQDLKFLLKRIMYGDRYCPWGITLLEIKFHSVQYLVVIVSSN